MTPRAPRRGSAAALPRHRHRSSSGGSDNGDDDDYDDYGGDGDGDETVDLQTFARALLSSDNDITGCRLQGMPHAEGSNPRLADPRQVCCSHGRASPLDSGQRAAHGPAPRVLLHQHLAQLIPRGRPDHVALVRGNVYAAPRLTLTLTLALALTLPLALTLTLILILTLTLTLTLTRHAPDKSTGHAFVIFNEEVATLVSALALALTLDLPQAPTPTLT